MTNGRPRTSALLEAFDEAVAAFDDSWTFIAANSRAEALTGRSAAEMAGMGAADFAAASAADRVTAAVETALADGEATVVVPLATGDGGLRRCEVTVRRLPADAPAAFVCIARDDTDRSTVGEAPEAVLDRVSDGFLAVDTDWYITYINEAAAAALAEATGLDPETTTFAGRHIWESIPDAEETAFYAKLQESMATGEELSFRTHAPAAERWFDARVFPSETGLSVYLYDITTQRRQHEQLETRERVLREMYEIIADRGRSFAEQVNALLALGRAELDAAYGALSRIEGEDYIVEYLDADADTHVLQAGDVLPLAATNCEVAASSEETLVLGDVERDAPALTEREAYAEVGIACYIGAPVFVDDEVYGTFCLYDKEPRAGQFSDWEVTLVDLMSRWVGTEIQRQSVTDRLQRQNERLDRFAGVLSHDLRNPLNVAQARLELLREGRGSDDDHLESIAASLDRMETLIEDVLTLARHGDQPDGTEPVCLSAAVERAWTMVDTGAATLTVEADLTFPAAPDRLQQLFENLLRNALDHGGTDVSVRVGALPAGDGFYVEDDGPGVPSEDREAVFEPGYSTAEAGTGFGLAIVQEIASAHGWTVTATGSDRGGARFEVTGVQA